MNLRDHWAEVVNGSKVVEVSPPLPGVLEGM